MLSKLVWGLCLLTLLAEGLQPAGPGGLTKVRRDIFTRDTPNDFGDPIQGDPVTNINCALGDFVTFKRDVEKAESVPVLNSRAPVEKQPLKNPASDSDKDFVDFLNGFKTGQQLETRPSKSQVDAWTIPYRGANIPIGATAVYFPFGKTAQTFVMESLIGCTGIIAVSKNGIWAAHLWEGSTTVNGGSSFTKKYINRDGDIADGVRTKAEFQKVAVDIFGAPTSSDDQKLRPLWLSIPDLKSQKSDPFNDGKDVEMFLLTKSKSPTNRDALYPDKATQLQDNFADLIPGLNYQQNTYAFEDPAVPEDLQGLIGIQYTPYDSLGGEDGCTPQARVRVFYENNKKAVIDKSWDATTGQTKRRRDECGSILGLGK